MGDSIIKRTTNRKKEDEFKKKILQVLSKNEVPKATQEIASELNKPWHSVQTRCLQLQISGKILGFRVGRINLWQAKK